MTTCPTSVITSSVLAVSLFGLAPSLSPAVAQEFRIETDSMGPIEVPADRYWGHTCAMPCRTNLRNLKPSSRSGALIFRMQPR